MIARELFDLAAQERDRQLRVLDLLPAARSAWMGRRHHVGGLWRERLALGGYALAGAAAAALLLMNWGPAPIRYAAVGLVRSAASANGAMQPTGQNGSFRFSDGSVVTLDRGTRAGVREVRVKGAQVRLDHGQLTADIVHEQGTSWQFRAGDFEVLVTGTRFDLSWEDSTAELALHMWDGTVRLHGCGMAPMTVGPGESIRIRCLAGRATQAASEQSASPMNSAGPMPTDSTAAPVDSSAGPAGSHRLKGAEPVVEKDEDAPADWRASLHAGQLREAWLAAESAGFADTCESASGPELLALADAASYARHGDRATMALLAVRRRFPGSPASSLAAFRLGRNAFDGRGGPSEARRWFTTYLRESPGGGLREEALGRLLELEQRAGNLEAARERALEYLRSYPQGPYADIARSLSSP